MPTETKKPQLGAAEIIGQLTGGYVVSSALNAITRLGVADLLAEGPESVSQLAAKTGTHEDSLCRVLRLLCGMSIFTETADRTFANNELSESLRADVPNSQRDMVLFIGDSLHFQAYADMLPTIKDGRTAAEHVWNKGIFEVFADDPAAQQRFDRAMTYFSQNAAPKILEAYDFSGIGTLVDVAGGHGYLLSAILRKHPEVKGIIFDLPHVVGGATERMEQLGLSSRCQAVSGDFFKAVPQGDAIVMKHIIHDWDNERAHTILESCHKALSPSGSSARLLIVEWILGDPPSRFMDVEMLMLPGGRERTESEYRELLDKAGFKLLRCIPTKSNYVIIEAGLK